MGFILYNRSINKSGVFSSDIYVNVCFQLMSNTESIVGELMDFALESDSRIDGISDHQFKQVCDTIILFFRLCMCISVVC